MTDTPISELSFEAAMVELESLVSRLESANIPLDESIAAYERGAALKAHCEAVLKAAEEKVSKISFGADGKPAGLESEG